MSRFYILALAALAGGVLSAHADPAAGDAAPAERYQLKSRSSFAAPEISRPPFWPIGFVKKGRVTEAPAAPAPVAKLSPEMFAVTSILLGNPSLAVINGRAYGEGEYLRLARATAGQGSNVRGAVATSGPRIRVIRILDGMVTLQSSDGQSVVVPMRRNQLNERKADPAEQELLLGNQ